MSGGRTTFVDWYKSAPVPWLVAGPNGQKEAGTWPAVLEQLSQQMDDARKCAYPDYAPTDALPHLGGDRQLIQGSNESDLSFRARLKDVWGQWSRAGQAVGVLEQLWYFGLTTATWYQQNGLGFAIAGTPTPGQDPTALLGVGPTSALASTLSSSVAPYRQIPAGTPWWFFDSNTDLCNRFQIVVFSWPFSSLVTAYFNGTDFVDITWPVGFASSTYTIIYGTPTAPVVLSVDGATQTSTGVTLRASGAWTGSVQVIGYAAGVDPFNTFSGASLGQLKSIISTFRPNAICMGVTVYQSGRQWGTFSPGSHSLWGDGWTWGGSTTQVLGSF